MRSPRASLRIARTLLSTQYAYMLEYRAEIALWALSGVLPLIMLGVWQNSGAASQAGWSPAQLRHYFVAAFIVRQFSVVWLIHVFEEDVVSGKLSPFLLQPLQPLWRYFAAHLAEQATRIPFVAIMLLALSAVDPGLLWRPSLQELLLGLMALWGAFVLRFLLQTLSSMLCFWSERAAALDRLLVIPYLFLSGLVAPLDTFPPAVQRFALATPFPAMVDFPARLLSGLPVDLGGGYLSLLIWCLILSPLCCWGWQRGLRRYGAMGA